MNVMLSKGFLWRIYFSISISPTDSETSSPLGIALRGMTYRQLTSTRYKRGIVKTVKHYFNFSVNLNISHFGEIFSYKIR